MTNRRHNSASDALVHLKRTFTHGQLTHMAAQHQAKTLTELATMWAQPGRPRVKRRRSSESETAALLQLGRRLLRGWVRDPQKRRPGDAIPTFSLDDSVTIPNPEDEHGASPLLFVRRHDREQVHALS